MHHDSAKQPPTDGLAPRRILVIDDEAPFTRLLKINLEATGRYRVHTENDPLLALPAALDFRPELVLLDVMMPGIDGGDVVNRFREHPQLAEVAVFFLTATIKQAEVEAQAGRIGGLRFLAKPVDMQKLLGCLDAHFGL